MIRRPLSLMVKEEFFCLAPYIMPEVSLRIELNEMDVLQMWEDLINKAKDANLDVIETYVFWNIHESSPGNYNFEGRYDLVRFIKTVQKAGLYAHLRIGPYVCAEWNFGGFPVWLKYVPGISFRTDNAPFKAAMQQFTEKIVGMMKSENLFESQGGPIILSQIENEYQPEREALGKAGEAYVQWAAKMAVGLDTGVPWIMCKEDDAPDPIINTCNGFYCDEFSPNKPYKPTTWTEAWSGWFSEFGGTIPMRPVQDLAICSCSFHTKRWLFHGGTNFGRTAGGPFITTSYDYDAPIDEYGLIREPKYSHLKEFHRVIKLCERALLSSDPIVTSLGSSQEAHVFSSGKRNCVAFLSNYDSNSAARVVFNKKHFNLPPWSISILPDCKHVAFNTAKINITRDNSDYLWYMTSVDISPSESFLRGGQKPTLSVHSSGHAVHVFVNGKLSGSTYGTRKNTRFTFTGPVDLQAGANRIELLSIAVGLPVSSHLCYNIAYLPLLLYAAALIVFRTQLTLDTRIVLKNIGLHYEEWNTGILGPVVLQGLHQGHKDLSWQNWTYRAGLKGEAMNLISQHGASSVEWIGGALATQGQQPLKWYKAYFDAPEGNDPVALDMRSMGKGQVWINGQSIGRYWTASANGKCDDFHYAGTYRQTKCQLGCGQPTQKWYHVPRSWLKPTQNLLVLFEELGGDASKILLVKRTTS
ncbi:hypothetical protein RND71_027451 [Anisodus tanguticus]|uniref:Beta-galactosidase n=1 Tax=Anisodus tanguticus TaxID=243964 RepID=A0AAE1RJ98_9SOLA|nr:hypothetical protein RND71_027451 [Anisodus tanguticus]